MRRVLVDLGLSLVLAMAGCESPKPTEKTGAAAVAATLPAAPAIPAAPPARPDTVDCTRAQRFRLTNRPDTLVAIGTRHCWLTVEVRTDSSQVIYAQSEGGVGPAFAPPADTVGGRWSGRVRGYEETYTFILRDSTRRRVLLRQVLHKPDFLAVESREVTTVMNLDRPIFVGYSGPLRALVFVCFVGIPFSDVGSRATLVLGLDGRTRHLYRSGSLLFDAPDCDPQLSPAGRYVLTCTELLRPGQPPLKLAKPRANLHAARFLSDSTLLLVYEHGEYRPRPTAAAQVAANVSAPMTEADFVVTPAQRRLPTAFILTASGREIAHFKLKAGGAGVREIPRTLVKPALTYIFYEDYHKLVLVPKQQPGALVELPLKKLLKFKPPQHPREKLYRINTEFTRLKIYVDTLNVRSIRYQLSPA